MLVIETVSKIQEELSAYKALGKTVGFVPTMGALHDGHLSLVERSTNDNDITICSIFVNPTQFSRQSDLDSYPRSFEQDKGVLGQTACDILFYPSNDEIYPDEISEIIPLGDLGAVMEGSYRKDHFNGVTTVVKRFFDILKPDKAYFGLKDYQQYAIIKYMTEALDLPIEIVGCETLRSELGLALSSRNQLLDKKEINSALLFSKSLYLARSMVNSSTVAEIKTEVNLLFEEQAKCRLEYFEVADGHDLSPVDDLSAGSLVVAFIAGYVGEVRLIDNLILIP